MSRDFLFLQVTYDFSFDGYAIIRKDGFDSIRHCSNERTQRKIFNAEGLISKEYGFDKHLPLTNWSDILKTLKKYNYHIIVENINKDYLDFWIGQIIRITSKSVSIHNYNPDGELYEKPTVINFDTICNIKFGDRYSMTFRKYLREKKR